MACYECETVKPNANHQVCPYCHLCVPSNKPKHPKLTESTGEALLSFNAAARRCLIYQHVWLMRKRGARELNKARSG